MPGKRRKKRHIHYQKRTRHPIIWITLCLIGSAALWNGYLYLQKKPIWPLSAKVNGNNIHRKLNTSEPGRTTILLLGADMRPGDNQGNADVIMVASIDEQNDRIELMSIPRDTQVAFPDGKYHKINESLNLAGPELTMNLTENLLGMPIDNYALTYFDGLVQIIDTIHGIELNVPKRMFYFTGDKKHGYIHLRPGLQTLNGEQALGFVRYRKDALGDIGRTERQQIFLTALYKKLFDPANIRYMPSIARELWDAVDTDVSLGDMLHLASQAQKFKHYTLIHETLPGSFHDPLRGDPNDLSYWVINPAQVRYVSHQFFVDGIIQANPIQDPEMTKTWIPPLKAKNPVPNHSVGTD